MHSLLYNHIMDIVWLLVLTILTYNKVQTGFLLEMEFTNMFVIGDSMNLGNVNICVFCVDKVVIDNCIYIKAVSLKQACDPLMYLFNIKKGQINVKKQFVTHSTLSSII